MLQIYLILFKMVIKNQNIAINKCRLRYVQSMICNELCLFLNKCRIWDRIVDKQAKIVQEQQYKFEYLFINHLQTMSKIPQVGGQESVGLGGIFKYYCFPLVVHSRLNSILLPEKFTSFPLMMLMITLISNLLKVAIPFALQYLYTNINHDNVIEPVAIFLCVVILSYYFELKAEQVMNHHKLKIKTLLCQRAIKTALRKPYQELDNKKPLSSHEITCWSKISANINIFVNGYYISYITVVFQTMKAAIIVAYLFHKLGIVVFAGLFVGGCITQFILFVSRRIQQSNFIKLKVKQSKTNILTEYFARIVDYQMSWLDGFVGDRIDHLEDEYQRHLRRVKMLDAWCVGMWQFTQIGISSIVLCLFYFKYGRIEQCIEGEEHNDTIDIMENIQPATIIYLFQMLTYPMNAISWYIAGLRNAERAINQLSEGERNVQVQKKKEKLIEKFDYGYQVYQIVRKVKHGRIYAINSEDPTIFKKLALHLSNIGKQVGYAEQNGFMLPSVLQNLHLLSVQHLDSNQLRNSLDKMVSALSTAKCEELPMENLVTTFSGGQKMRLSLARAILHGKYIIIDSDLTSLDKSTRTKVLRNLRDYVAKRNDVIVVIKGKKTDEGIDKFINQFITVQIKFSRVFFQLNKNIRSSMKDSTTISQNQKNQQKSIIEQKILLEISKLLIFKGFNLSQSRQSSQLPQSNFPKKMAKKLKLSLQTLKFYFSYKHNHVYFIFSLVAMYAVGNYYNYFVNVNKPVDPLKYAWQILSITLLYIIFIAFRSILFAIANLKQSQRISSLTNNLLIYNHISFYDRLNIIQKQANSQQDQQRIQKQKNRNTYQNNDAQQQNNTYKNMNTQKLVCLCTSDEFTVNNNFPFSTNILWNNIATVTASLIMVFLEVPAMIIFTLIFVFMVKKLQKNFRTSNQSLILSSKDQQIKLMKSVNNIDQGALYLLVFNRKQRFLQIFNQQLSANIENINQQTSLSVWVRSNYRFNMILFLLFSIGLFWINPFHENQNDDHSKKSAKMSVMVRYILLLADYIFNLTMSISQCRGHAISIQRIRRFASNPTVINGSFERLKRSKQKKQGLIKSLKENQITKNKQFVNLRRFSYQYDKRSPLVLENINLRIRHGDKLILKGKTASGKTTLFKIIMGLYPQVYFPENSIHLMSFSSQHPLKMGECSTLQKLDPYKILQLVPPNIRSKVMQKANKILQKTSKNPSAISYEQEVIINNLRAFLYGYKGLAVFDEPQFVFQDSSTYIVVTHHGEFKSNSQFKLEKGMLFQVNQNQKN